MFCESDGMELEKLFPTVEVMESTVNLPSALSTISVEDGRVYFVSGPPAMLEAVRLYLSAQGVQDCRIKIDQWEDMR